ncbi:DUF4870 domain-containing protein [Gilvimarinus xylanilyticus]|uniref:DUF4870 domain-containing protein n=1 Tax=Gilvimarinus xylanilyticus TaxID=2944139 RepID=A0A9X2I718_9GAMM|nr:DUF4870 domain-containing protein [Gilvimarinus xylanilyticus]MCP8900032.1 DUF4870 domain-containing protein [Gilvimarinus xylanilyticus]
MTEEQTPPTGKQEEPAQAPQNTQDTSLSEPSQDSKNMALLVWIGSIFFGFIPGLILYLVKADDAYVKDQSQEALNWGITVLIGYAIAMALTVILIGALLFPLLWILNLIFSIMGAIASSKGEPFRCPFALRLLK